MKNIGKLFLKAFVVIVLFTSGSSLLSGFGVKSVCEANAAVSYQQVHQYLVNRGYEIVELNPCVKNPNWIAHTIKNGIHYQTTVYVEGDQIVGLGDVTM